MNDSERVYKMDEAARALNREAQQRFRLRQRLKKAAARAIGNEIDGVGTPDAGSSPTSPPDAI
jgi:hypothetical protein